MMKTTNMTTAYALQSRKKKISLQEKNYETALAEAIDAAFAPLGSTITQLIYTYIEKTFKIKKQEIPNRPKEFAEAIEQIFGEGAKLIEIRIIKELHKRIRDFVHIPKKRKLEFTEYLIDLRAFLRVQKLRFHRSVNVAGASFL
ncbi:MAG: hypothetical protein QW674_07780 [Candidatus Bathyarchaeia archaeon]